MIAQPRPAPQAPPDAARLWRFAVEVYGRGGVADACLALQDEHGQDVTLLLCAAWAGAEAGRALSTAAARDLFGATAGWRGEVVAPLRSLRRRLKTGPAPAPNPQTAALRETIKRAELEAERIALAALAEASAGWPGAACGARTVQQNLAACFAAAGDAAEASASMHLARIAEAAVEVAKLEAAP